ncbi:tRNA (guanosine(46)-N7)-methyltransferase TrmB [Mogibacterium diversum]|jgi:tRNA (guanine-N(7)-)-methyltransferase|uniref:tRNA (guanosine(46)-N7)-methyltransferase TrmB n=1 Tax=Mogibacterium diversum TaxID=114527 RepID=UPI0027B9BDAC|nr:tRNA (guanosine(46)-N7)-methyltransferase TrmB [Mogibacterium diversum]
MRQRKVKNLEEKYARFEDILVYNPAEIRGKWAERAGESKGIYMEVGCGKGRFISQLASREPENFFIAVEGHKSVLLRAMEKVHELGLTNVVFIPEFIENLHEWFVDSELDGIYLNFSDPLPKNYSAKKRLTYRGKLKQYFDVLKEDGVVRFKTDNTDLFNYSINEVIASDLRIREFTRDLHASPYNEDNIMTEYEEKFSDKGFNIKMMEIGRIRRKGEKMGLAALNGREIPKQDKVFGISGRAKAAIKEKGHENVANATIGALLDDEGNLIVLSSVDEAVKSLEPSQYAEYAPIAGTPGFKEAAIKAALGGYETSRHIGIVSTPGGTGSLTNAIANYSCPGDKILTHNWCWPNYKNIAAEQGRGFETFEMFDEDGKFNLADFEYKVNKLLRIQDRLVLILNTPANNPTGYSLSLEEWKSIIEILNRVPDDKVVALVVDIAYIDFAGDEKKVREFIPELEKLKSNVLPLLAYSTSKTFTFYGFRCAALICLADSEEIADEFVKVCSYSSRSTWSNSPRGPQEVIAKIYSDKELLAKVDEERKEFRDMLLARGRAFEEEAKKVNLKIVPFRAGFFVSIPCENPDALSAKLEESDVYCVPMDKGVRVSIASISEAKCRKLPAIIKDALESL